MAGAELRLRRLNMLYLLCVLYAVIVFILYEVVVQYPLLKDKAIALYFRFKNRK